MLMSTKHVLVREGALLAYDDQMEVGRDLI